MASPNVSSDMAQFFDFGEAAMGTEISRLVSSDGGHRVGCPAYGQEGDEGCLCAAFNQDIPALDAPHAEIAPADEFNTDFSSWLPRYLKPANPCEYCRSKSLECFIYDSSNGEITACSPCNALFRPCSFTNPEKMPMQMKKTALDTLHSVAEVSERTFGSFTGRKTMRSLGHQGPIEPEDPEDKAPKKGAAAARFPRAAVKILKDWMVAHIDHPYPSEEQKEILATQTGLTLNQISNWMANTRRRYKARPKRSASPSIRPSTEPVNIPPGRTWETLNPFERWKHSPPENEPAPMQAIVRNVETFDFPDEQHSASSSYRKENSNDSTGSFSVFRAPSTTSLETGLTVLSSGSLGSHNSAYSHSSRHSLGSLNSLKSKERRRRRRMPTRAPKLDLEEDARLFQCTFCTDRFKSKYDWTRHEKSLHLSLEKWLCAPLGDVITCSASGQRKCVYCDEVNPSNTHLESHNHRACQEKGLEARTFYRKDHLRQHLRLMHGCKMIPSMEVWKAEAQVINSRCGFCGQTFVKWQDRADHLAKEFRNGATMKNWKGCRGLDRHVAAHVTNAMPPYLIANESKSPFPFSATNTSSISQLGMSLAQTQLDLEAILPSQLNDSPMTRDLQMGGTTTASTTQNPSPQKTSSRSSHPYATCWEILTLRLGRFARQHMEQHGRGSVTDALLQSEARRILYDEDDPWHDTAADNPEWLRLFRKAHGLDDADADAVPTTISQHEVLEDLGLRPNAQLDESFNLDHFACVRDNFHDPVLRARAFECTLSGSMAVSQAAEMGVSTSCMSDFPTASGADNFPPTTTFADFQALNAVMSDFDTPSTGAGAGVGGFHLGEDGEIRSTSASASFSKGLNAYMTPITQMGCNAGGEGMDGDFGFGVFEGVGMGESRSAGMVGGAMGWAEADLDLTFSMDMDMDLGMGMGV